MPLWFMTLADRTFSADSSAAPSGLCGHSNNKANPAIPDRRTNSWDQSTQHSPKGSKTRPQPEISTAPRNVSDHQPDASRRGPRRILEALLAASAAA